MSKPIISLKELDYKDLAEVGGKASSLGIFYMQGVPVHSAVFLAGNVYDAFVLNNKKIQELIFTLKRSGESEARRILSEIIKIIMEISFSEQFSVLLLNHLSKIHFPHFYSLAVRPSILYRESPKDHIPDIHHSVMNVEIFPDVLNSVKLVWASLWSYRAFEYRNVHFIPHERVSMGVILQQMMKVDYSGVAIREGKNTIKIRSSWGMPQPIKEEKIPFDEMLWKEEREGEFCLLREKTAIKNSMEIYDGQDLLPQEVPLNKQQVKILSAPEQNEILNITKKIEPLTMEGYQGIIWAHERNIAFLSQIPAPPQWENIRIREFTPPCLSPLSLSVFENYRNKELSLTHREDKEKKIKFFLGNPYITLKEIEPLLNKYQIISSWAVEFLSGNSLSGDFGKKLTPPSGILESAKIKKMIRELIKKGNEKYARINNILNDVQQLSPEKMEKKDLGTVTDYIVKEMGNCSCEWEMLLGIMSSVLQLFYLNKSFKKTFIEISSNLLGIPPLHYLSSVIEILREILETGISPHQTHDSFSILLSRCPRYSQIHEYQSLLTSLMELNDKSPSFFASMLKDLLLQEETRERIRNKAPVEKHLPKEISGDFLSQILSLGGNSIRDLMDSLKSLVILNSNIKYKIYQLYFYLKKTLIPMSLQMEKCKIIHHRDDIYFLNLDEVLNASSKLFVDYTQEVRDRKKIYSIWQEYTLPPLLKGRGVKVKEFKREIPVKNRVLCGMPLCEGKAQGTVRVISPPEYKEIKKGDLAVINRLSFLHTPYLLTASGIIIENLNPDLSDLFILKYLGIPAVGGFPGISRLLKNGMNLLIDGDGGYIAN